MILCSRFMCFSIVNIIMWSVVNVITCLAGPTAWGVGTDVSEWRGTWLLASPWLLAPGFRLLWRQDYRSRYWTLNYFCDFCDSSSDWIVRRTVLLRLQFWFGGQKITLLVCRWCKSNPTNTTTLIDPTNVEESEYLDDPDNHVKWGCTWKLRDETDETL